MRFAEVDADPVCVVTSIVLKRLHRFAERDNQFGGEAGTAPPTGGLAFSRRAWATADPITSTAASATAPPKPRCPTPAMSFMATRGADEGRPEG